MRKLRNGGTGQYWTKAEMLKELKHSIPNKRTKRVQIRTPNTCTETTLQSHCVYLCFAHSLIPSKAFWRTSDISLLFRALRLQNFAQFFNNLILAFHASMSVNSNHMVRILLLVNVRKACCFGPPIAPMTHGRVQWTDKQIVSLMICLAELMVCECLRGHLHTFCPLFTKPDTSRPWPKLAKGNPYVPTPLQHFHVFLCFSFASIRFNSTNLLGIHAAEHWPEMLVEMRRLAAYLGFDAPWRSDSIDSIDCRWLQVWIWYTCNPVVGLWGSVVQLTWSRSLNTNIHNRNKIRRTNMFGQNRLGISER